eukprot:4261438-Pyramimonas_sp.AAC.1
MIGTVVATARRPSTAARRCHNHRSYIVRFEVLLNVLNNRTAQITTSSQVEVVICSELSSNGDLRGAGCLRATRAGPSWAPRLESSPGHALRLRLKGGRWERGALTSDGRPRIRWRVRWSCPGT